MGPLYWEWTRQYTATDQLLAGMFLFGTILAGGYYAVLLLPWDEKLINWLQKFQAVLILSIIVLTLLAPTLVDMGVIAE